MNPSVTRVRSRTSTLRSAVAVGSPCFALPEGVPAMDACIHGFLGRRDAWCIEDDKTPGVFSGRLSARGSPATSSWLGAVSPLFSGTREPGAPCVPGSAFRSGEKLAAKSSAARSSRKERSASNAASTSSRGRRSTSCLALSGSASALRARSATSSSRSRRLLIEASSRRRLRISAATRPHSCRAFWRVPRAQEPFRARE
jgi:hypothetical protein